MKQRIENLLNSVRLIERELEDILEELSASTPKPSSNNVRKLNLAFIVGHTQKSPGASGSNIIPNEYFYHRDMMVPHLRKMSNDAVDISIHYRDGIGIAGAYKSADESGADCVIELHYNGAASTQATGTETLYVSEKGKVLAECVQEEMLTALGLRDRGVKYVPRSGRGGYNLRAGNAVAVIVEPAFGSNTDDAVLLRDRVETLAQAYVNGAINYWRKINA
jgi:N-acetylmuramoyl-L-alanine amidase